MAYSITSKPIPVLIDGHDTEGMLVLADGQLAAVIARLDGRHHSPEQIGRWHLEAGFGKCAAAPGPDLLWNTLEDAEAWVQERLSRSP